MSGDPGSPTIHTQSAFEVPAADVGEGVAQRVLAGRPRGDESPLLLGITTVSPHCTSRLIEHDTAELAYVLSGSGLIVTEITEHPFQAGDSIMIDAGCWHAIRALEEPVEMLYVFPSPDAPPTRQHPSQLA